MDIDRTAQRRAAIRLHVIAAGGKQPKAQLVRVHYGCETVAYKSKNLPCKISKSWINCKDDTSNRYATDRGRAPASGRRCLDRSSPEVGKTTLALEIGRAHDALYLDLEDRDDRNRPANPVLFFESFEDRLTILDEIHRMPGLFQTLRGVIDTGRRRKKGKGRFLILGSASIALLRQSGETLAAGRIAYIDMAPLSALEIEDNRGARESLWLRGGFPDSYLAESDRDSFSLRKDFIRTYLERDVPRIPAITLERLWTMLAHRQGTLLNASELARAIGGQYAIGDALHRPPGRPSSGSAFTPLSCQCRQASGEVAERLGT